MKLTHSIVAIAALSTLSFAGGDINPVTVFEQEPVKVPVEPVKPEPKPEVVAPVVPAAKNFYVAGGLTDIAVRAYNDTANLFTDKDNQDRQLGLTGRIGYDFMEYLGAELRGTYGISKDAGTKFKQIGGYLKPNYDLTDTLNLYGLVGLSKTNAAGIATKSGLSYGLGLDYAISDTLSVFTDVVNYLDKSKQPSQLGLTLGAAYRF